MPDPGLTFFVTLAATLASTAVAYFARKLHQDLQAFLTTVERAEQRSRDNADVLADHNLIEQSDTDHMRTERRRRWRREARSNWQDD
jgi:DNA-binding transcriptional regulator YbjK